MKKTLSHSGIERPGRQTVLPQIIGQMNERGIRVQYRIGSNVFVEQKFVAEQEVAKYQRAHHQQRECNDENDNARTICQPVIRAPGASAPITQRLVFVLVHVWYVRITQVRCEVPSK